MRRLLTYNSESGKLKYIDVRRFQLRTLVIEMLCDLNEDLQKL
jgi:hypothetical protein